MNHTNNMEMAHHDHSSSTHWHIGGVQYGLIFILGLVLTVVFFKIFRKK